MPKTKRPRLVTPTDVLQEIVRRQRSQQDDNPPYWILTALFIMCQSLVARKKKEYELEARIRKLEAKDGAS